MLFDFATIPARERYKLMVATIVPRPMRMDCDAGFAWAVECGAIFFFQCVGGDPPVVGIGIGSHDPGRPKDTRQNIRDTGQFVVNLVSEEVAERMNITAIEFEHGVSEPREAGLTTVPSLYVKPPRIGESPVSMECELMQIIELGRESGLVLGRILAMHVRDEMVIDPVKHHIDTPKLKLIGRMHGAGWYARTSDLFKMDRIPRHEWKLGSGKAERK